jgi:hypothetical protein
MTTKTVALFAFLAAAAVAGACATPQTSPPKPIHGAPVGATGGDPEDPDSTDGSDGGVLEIANGSQTPPEDPLASLPQGAAQLAITCGRGINNVVTQALCANPPVTGVADVQRLLGLGFADPSSNGKNGTGGNPAFALLGHSSSLITRDVSAINPRALLFTSANGVNNKPTPGFVILGFTRGEQLLEMIAQDKTTGNINFYLLTFTQDCNANGGLCNYGDLLTPAVESNWRSWTLYQDEDLKNTVFDCLECHQPGGPSTKPILRMQEIHTPWTHWFRSDNAGGVALLDDFHAAHGNAEPYGPVPAALINKSDGRALEDLVEANGFGTQPNFFDSPTIEREVQASSSAQPELNGIPGMSPTWQKIYDAAASGADIPVPYHDVKVTDGNKVVDMSRAYQGFLQGMVMQQDLPDIRRVFLASALSDLTFRPKEGLDGKAVLVQMCAQCHNPGLDQTISRAHFDVTQIDSMSRAQKDNAIARMQAAPTSKLRMPPIMLRSFTNDALAAAVQALQQ